MSKEVILTGLRANSEFHLGNYLGAILPMVELQKAHAGKHQINMFVPDLHSFTTPIDHGKLYQNVLDNIKVYIAAGLDISNPDTYIYRQSFVPAHSELAWILGCFAYFGELSRMTQFKEKSDNSVQSAGLFNYPVLMAADILLYDSNYVPLGDDQKQHLELARDIAIRINNKFGEVFTVPHNWEKQLEFTDRSSVRVRSLRHPDKKMSKSIEDPAGTIMLSDSPQEAAKKVIGAETDSIGVINLNWKDQPGISNLLQISALLSKHSLEDVAKHWQGKSSYGELKKHVAAQVQDCLTDLQRKLSSVDQKAMVDKLEQDEAKINDIANKKLGEVQKVIGLRKK